MTTIKDHQLYTNLAKVANSTFGTTGPGGADANRKLSTQSIKFFVVDEHTIKASYQAIVTFASTSMYRDLQKVYREEAIAMLQGAIKLFVEEYGKLEPQPKKKTIKLSINNATITDSVEHVSYNSYKPVQTGFYRVQCNLDVK